MTSKPDRRNVVAGMGAITAGLGIPLLRAEAETMNEVPEIVFFNGRNVPASDRNSFWGAIGCSCWAF